MSIGMVSAILVVFGITLWFDHAQLKTVREGRVLYWCMIAIASALLIWGLFAERGDSPAIYIIDFLDKITGGLIHEK